MTTYERVRYKDFRVRWDGKKLRDTRTIILMNPVEVEFMGAPALSGVEVNREGEEVAPRGVDERRHIIGLDVITKRTQLVMNNHYGILEEVL